jgi:hypothetical protein
MNVNAIAEETQDSNGQGDTRADLAELLVQAGETDEPVALLGEALAGLRATTSV